MATKKKAPPKKKAVKSNTAATGLTFTGGVTQWPRPKTKRRKGG